MLTRRMLLVPLSSLLFFVGVFAVEAQTTTTTLPNLVLLHSDDYGWTYYGFMQRFMRESLDQRCLKNFNVCTTDAECGGAGPCVRAAGRCGGSGNVCATDAHCGGTLGSCVIGTKRCAGTGVVCTTDASCGAGGICYPPSGRCSDSGTVCGVDSDCSPSAYCLPALVARAGLTGSAPEYDDQQMILPDDNVGESQCTGGSQAGRYCQSNADCPSGTCTITIAGTPPVHTFLTPAMDDLAETGSYFPYARTSASICMPAMTSEFTGLLIGDMVIPPGVTNDTTSPVITEWLPGWGQSTTPFYLTMCAGKCSFGEPHIDPITLLPKQPWDREMPPSDSQGDPTYRDMLEPHPPIFSNDDAWKNQAGIDGRAMQRIKEFIACASCSSPGACVVPGDVAQDPPSTRMQARTPTCPSPQAFYLMFAPFIPHSQFRPEEYCPYFPRDATQCAQEPWHTHSVYCQPPFGPQGQYGYADCAQIDAWLSTIKDNITIEAQTVPARTADQLYYSTSNRSYLRFVNVFDRAVDELMVHLKDKGLFGSTVITYVTDNGFLLSGSKGFFAEHGHRSPMILKSPFATGPQASCGPNLPGCRPFFAQSIDLLATFKDFAGNPAQTCPPPNTVCGPGNGCCPPPDRYEGRSLRNPSLRPCEFPSYPGEPLKNVDPTLHQARYRQCVVSRKQVSGQTISPGKGFYILAEIEEPSTGIVHLCKYYRQGSACNDESVFDLNFDPNENLNMHGDPIKCVGGTKDGQLCSVSAPFASGTNTKCPPDPATKGTGVCKFCTTEELNLNKILRWNASQNGWLQNDCNLAGQWPVPQG